MTCIPNKIIRKGIICLCQLLKSMKIESLRPYPYFPPLNYQSHCSNLCLFCFLSGSERMRCNQKAQNYYQQLMLQAQKSKDLIQQINRIFRRLQHVKQVKKQLFEFIMEVQQLYSTFSQKIHKEMTAFEERIIKNTLYSTQKTNEVINVAKIYREFSIQLEKNAKLNLINLQTIKSDQIVKQQQKLQKKCDIFLKQFKQYLQSQKKYRSNLSIYTQKCNILDQVITKCQSYNNTIRFYNQSFANEYIYQLDRQYNQCSNFETAVMNQAQGLDQTRKWMTQHIKEINEYYVILLHIYLGIIDSIINFVVNPHAEEKIEKKRLALRNKESQEGQNQNIELEKLNNLYASELNNQNVLEDNIIEEYSQLFKKSFTQNQLNSDYKFFYDRCDSIRKKKLKTTEELCKIQELLISEFANQCDNYYSFEKEYKTIEKDIFTKNGIDSFKKRFRKYFGSNFMEIQELCMTVIERQKKALEKIGKGMQDSKDKLSKLLENKQESIKLFEKRTKMILDQHLKLKEKTYARETVNSQQLKNFKDSIANSFNQLKKSFLQLQKNESQSDKLFFSNLTNHYDIILKEAINKNMTKLLEKEKNRVNILKSLNVDSQIVVILKQDSRYQMLLNECPKPNLYITFQSLVKKQKYDETKRLLQEKENTLKNMMRTKKGCCGMKSEPIKDNVLSDHQCILISDKQFKGILNITSNGVIFQEKSWNPFYDGLRLMVPQNDINAFDIKNSNNKEYLQIITRHGNLTFSSKVCNDIIQSMQKNITFRQSKEVSQRGNKRNDSSSFIKNNTSTQYKLSYDKSVPNLNTEGSNKIGNKNEKTKQTKTKAFETIIKQFIKKWKQLECFSQHFTKVPKVGQNNGSRRDYTYQNGYSKFYLKQRRDYQVQGKDIVLTYEWKISFPESPMLHSFKHSQKVTIENITKQLRVRIVTGKYCEEQLYIKSRFYKEVEDMNNNLSKFIVNSFEKEADILIQPQNEDNKSIDSSNIVVQEGIFQENRDSKFQRADSTFRNSRLDRQRNSLSMNGFKTQ